MTFDVINNKAFAFHETVKNGSKEHTIISFAEIVDYELFNNTMLEKVTIKQIIELDKYIKGEEYISVIRTFMRPFPFGVGAFINGMNQIKGGGAISY